MIALLLAAVPAGAEGRLSAGTREFTLAGAYSVSHEISGTEAGLTGFQLLPHLGLVLTEPWGPAWIRGQVEALAEPTLVNIEGPESTNLVGLSALARWVFASRGASWWRPYVEAGVGVVTGEPGLPQLDCEVNFILQTGVGVLLFWSETSAVTLGYRLHHVSNSNLCGANRGLNSAVFMIGLSRFFD
ncbi:MAG: acyloxyacyl hydrolase [Candidatus Rokuibacteriota bacterium]